MDKNIFCTIGNNVLFSDATNIFLKDKRSELSSLTYQQKTYIIQYLADEFVKTFCSSNQYMNFYKEDYSKIVHLYALLFDDLNNFCLNTDEIQNRHYSRIQDLIKTTNHFIYEINCNCQKEVSKTACFEYSPEFQLELLEIVPSQLAEPILDIGCGQHGYLVSFLCDIGLEAYGIDRFNENCRKIKCVNWLEYDYGVKEWGTIISNLSFSNHFLNNFLRNDGDHVRYTETYMRILSSLKLNGVWIYAPSVPFIENLLPKDKYRVVRTNINSDFSKTKIQRL